MATAMAERCAGRGCGHKVECALYKPPAYQETEMATHGYLDSDEGWVCQEWVRKDAPVVETDDDQGQLF